MKRIIYIIVFLTTWLNFTAADITFRGSNVDNILTIENITPVLEADGTDVKQKIEIELKTNWRGLVIDIPTTASGITEEDVVASLEEKVNGLLLMNSLVNYNDEEGTTSGALGLKETLYDLSYPNDIETADINSFVQTASGFSAGGGDIGGGGPPLYDIVFVVGATSQTFASKGVANTVEILKEWVLEYKQQIIDDEFRINIIEHGGRKGYEDSFYNKNTHPLEDYIKNPDNSRKAYFGAPWKEKKSAKYDSMFLVGYNGWLTPDELFSTASNAPLDLIGTLSQNSAYGSNGGENSAWGIYEAINFLAANNRADAQKVIFFISNQPMALFGNGVSFLGSSYEDIPLSSEIFKPVGNNVEAKYKEALIYDDRRDNYVGDELTTELLNEIKDPVGDTNDVNYDYSSLEETLFTQFANDIALNDIDFVYVSSLSEQNAQALLKARVDKNNLNSNRYYIPFFEFNQDIDPLGHVGRDLWDFSGSAHAVTYPILLSGYVDEENFYIYESSDNENNLHSYLDDILADYFRKKSLFQKWLLTYYSPMDTTFYQYKKVHFSLGDFKVEADDPNYIRTTTKLTKTNSLYLETTFDVPKPVDLVDTYYDRYYAAKELALTIEYTNPKEIPAFGKVMLLTDDSGETQIEAIITETSPLGFTTEDKISYAYFTIDELPNEVLTATAVLDPLNNSITYRYTLDELQKASLVNETLITIRLFTRIRNATSRRTIEVNGDGDGEIITHIDFVAPVVSILGENKSAAITLAQLRDLFGSNLFTTEEVEGYTEVEVTNLSAPDFYGKLSDLIGLTITIDDLNITSESLKKVEYNNVVGYDANPLNLDLTIPVTSEATLSFIVSNVEDDFGNKGNDLELVITLLDNPTYGTIGNVSNFFNTAYTLDANHSFHSSDRIVSIILPFVHDNSVIDTMPDNYSSHGFGAMWAASKEALDNSVSFDMFMPVESDPLVNGGLKFDGEYGVIILLAVNQAGGVSPLPDNSVFDLSSQTLDPSAEAFMTTKFRVDTIAPQQVYFRKTDMVFKDANGTIYNQFDKTLFIDDDTVTLTSIEGKAGDVYTVSTTDVSIDINNQDLAYTITSSDEGGTSVDVNFTPADLAGNLAVLVNPVTINTTSPDIVALNANTFEQLSIELGNIGNTFPFTKYTDNLYVLGNAYANALDDNIVTLSDDFNVTHNKDYLIYNGLKEINSYAFSQAGMVAPSPLEYVYDKEINYYNTDLIGTFIAERIGTTFEADISLRNISEFAGLDSVSLVSHSSNISGVSVTPVGFANIISTKELTLTPESAYFILGFTLDETSEVEVIKILVRDKLANEKELSVTVTVNDYLRILGETVDEDRVIESTIHIINNNEFNVDSVETTTK